MKTKKISLLGATGSIGTQTLDIIQSNKEQFKLVSFSAGMNIAKVREITAQFRPEIVSVMQKVDATLYNRNSRKLVLFMAKKG